ASQPFDAQTRGSLRQLVNWLPRALGELKAGVVPASFGLTPMPVATASTAETSTTAPEMIDVLLELNLGENRELLSEFHAETVDHLAQIEAALLALDHEPENPEALNSIFRSFHTIKGNAGFLGLVPMH